VLCLGVFGHFLLMFAVEWPNESLVIVKYTEGVIDVEDVSVGSLSGVVVEDASIDAFSNTDDSDSCFSACLALGSGLTHP